MAVHYSGYATRTVYFGNALVIAELNKQVMRKEAFNFPVDFAGAATAYLVRWVETIQTLVGQVFGGPETFAGLALHQVPGCLSVVVGRVHGGLVQVVFMG